MHFCEINYDGFTDLTMMARMEGTSHKRPTTNPQATTAPPQRCVIRTGLVSGTSTSTVGRTVVSLINKLIVETGAAAYGCPALVVLLLLLE